MRVPRYLSASNIFLFYSDRKEYYLKYLAEQRPPRMAQTKPMSVGSAFDAFAKSFIYEKIFGDGNQMFECRTLFEAQVEKQNWDSAWKAGKNVFDQYKASGALRDLMKLLRKATDIKMETRCEGELFGVPFLGFPDLQFKLNNRQIIIDWKVNGFYSKSGASPKKGFIKCTDGFEATKQSRRNGLPHKDATLFDIDGMEINISQNFEACDSKWAFQTLLYCWLNGVAYEDNPIIGIDQLVCRPGGLVRVAQHRGRVSKQFREDSRKKIIEVWDVINRGHVRDSNGETIAYPHIFTNMLKADSDAECKVLEGYHAAFSGDEPIDKWFAKTTRQSRMW